ncbi:GyrI-like domain-containing protein [Microtetraspora sp. AC03309]|uniref:MerR family transcriptional regulator n=1 Tax=Microtetraspora sp. AC03309 TaxID=2779376 RepID=UPI001E455EB0|nr:GyrI-like domain-containing protein [Microtetraspora sp. AC03309]MCC5575784.1 GyrI-like domain-containing protein [Microtetraspora sp. AC03309]
MLDRVNDDLLSIGQFARLARLSVKQLRNYADLGLLEPVWIDPDSGYRYYRAGQARAALAIGLLRSLDVPLAVIATVIATVIGPMADTGETLNPVPADQVADAGSPRTGDRRAASALARVRDDLETELARRRRTLQTLERILESGLPTPQVSVVTEPPRRVAVLRDVAATPEEIGRVTSACVARLLAALGQGAGPERAAEPGTGGGPVWLIGLFPVDFGDTVPVTVGVVLPGTVVPGEHGHGAPPGTSLDILPGGAFARATHVGPYDQIALTAHALLAWCAERGHFPAGPLREVYVSDPSTTPSEQLVTHLMIPLEDMS